MLKANLIESYNEYHTEETVRFVIRMNTKKLYRAQKLGLHKVFRLRSMLSLYSMVLFDSKGCVKFYDSPEQILLEFFEIRKNLYKKRKKFLNESLSAHKEKAEEQLRFMQLKLSNDIVIDKLPKDEIIRILKENGFKPDPVKVWKDNWYKSSEGKKDESEVKEEEDGDKDEEDQKQVGLNPLN